MGETKHSDLGSRALGGANVDRRSLLRAGAAAAAVGLVACDRVERGGGRDLPDRQDRPVDAPPFAFELDELSIDDLGHAMAKGRLSARRITELYLERIAATNQQGPQLRAVIETNPDALAIAERLDQERAAGTLRSPLHGIPILLKDNVATADQTATSAGSLALAGAPASADAAIAAALRAQGAVLLGKANMSEWANFRSRQSTSGWSARGGQCRNPYVLDRNPCGSSSGSGVAVSANLCAAAIGTETNGSIVCPSSANGIVGIKPTVGLVSRGRIIPISASQDTAGPMARTVRDAAILLGALVGEDPADPATAGVLARAHRDYTPFLDAARLRGARLGVVRGFFGFDDRVDALMAQALEALAAAGAELIDPVELPRERAMGDASYEVMLHEFKAGLNDYLRALGEGAAVRSLAEVIAFNDSNAAAEMPWFGQDILLAAQEKSGLDDPAYRTARATMLRLSREHGIDAVLARHRLDALVAPTGGPAWLTDWVNGDHFGGGSSSPAAIAGYPNITVPAGAVHGLPVGISFFGAAYAEPTLLGIAYGYEQATRLRRAPRFVPTIA